jgi:hypothetical protein
LRHCQFFCHRSCTILYSHQQCIKVPISSHPCQHLFSVFIMATLVSVKWYCIMALICIYIMTNEVQRLFMYLLVIFTSSTQFLWLFCLFNILIDNNYMYLWVNCNVTIHVYGEIIHLINENLYTITYISLLSPSKPLAIMTLLSVSKFDYSRYLI